MDVIIVSKTHMSATSCVGGVLANGRFVRLLDIHGKNQPVNTELNIGDVYEIIFTDRKSLRPPHIEDIIISSIKFKFSFASIPVMVDYLINKLNIEIWRGSPDVLFNRNLLWTDSGSGYISALGQIPNCSVGFWISDCNLDRRDFNGKVRYNYSPIHWRNISFVGFQTPVDIIPSGTLIRVSLARWWSPNENEERCYLQMSGWYGLADSITDYEDIPW